MKFHIVYHFISVQGTQSNAVGWGRDAKTARDPTVLAASEMPKNTSVGKETMTKIFKEILL